MRKHHSRRYPVLKAAAFAAAFVSLLAAAPPLDDLPPPIWVQVEGEGHYLARATTFADVVRRFHLKPSSGDLLDVEGEILKKQAYPGRVLLNGRRREEGANVRLSDGDTIRVVNGRDRKEAIVTEVREAPGGQPRDPQTYLGTVPGELVIKKGKFSGKLVSSVFRANGEVSRPASVALTFDDGPWPTTTSQVLDVLERYGVKATFFVVGYLAERYPELIRREVRAGMSVANHSWSHPEPFPALSAKEAREQIARTKDLLSSMGATGPAFRPPGGRYTKRTIGIARKLGYRHVLWSVDPQDWNDTSTAREIARNVLENVGPGSIILLHDGGGDQSATVEALPAIIEGIRAIGLTFAAL